MPNRTVTCRCGTEFEVPEHRIKNGRGRHCSRACQYAARRGSPPCSVTDCDRPNYGLGMCKLHYGRRVRLDTTDLPVTSLVDRWDAKVDKTGDCWLWTGAINNKGYGVFATDEGNQLAHRVSYVMFVGPIPEGLELDHVYARGCRHRHCVNPDHLEAVTHAENVRRTGRAA